MKFIKREIYWWFVESKILDWIEEKMIYSRFDKISNLGMKIWKIRMSI